MTTRRRLAVSVAIALALGSAVGYVTPAGAQWVTNFLGRTFTSSAPTGINGFACRVNGCRVDLGTGASDYLYSDGVSVTTVGPMTAGSFYSATGQFIGNGVPLMLRGSATDGAAAISAKVVNTASLTTAGAKVVAFYSDNATTEVRAIDKNGADVYPLKCDSSGTPGAATCSQAAGQAAIAAAAASVVITNTLVTTASIVRATLQVQDTTCLYVRSVVPALGSFTINVNAACTAAAKVAWVLDAK